MYVHPPEPVDSRPVCSMSRLAVGSGEFPALVGADPDNAGRRAVARLGRSGVKSVTQGMGVLSVPGGLVLSGHPAAGIVFFSIAAGSYGLILLSALFGSTEISRRGFRLLGRAENPTENSRDHSEDTHVRNPSVVIAGDGSEGGRKR